MKFDKGYFGKAVKEMSDREICRHFQELIDLIDIQGFTPKNDRAINVMEGEINRRGIEITETMNKNNVSEYHFENRNGEDINL